MAKYHIRKDGLPGECRAKAGNCPLGSDEEHFSNKMEALQASEEKLREEGNFLVSVKKHKIFHVGRNGAMEECPFRDGYCNVRPFDTFDNLHSASEDVIDGAAKAFREAAGSLPSIPRSNEQLEAWEEELLNGDAARADADSTTSVNIDPKDVVSVPKGAFARPKPSGMVPEDGEPEPEEPKYGEADSYGNNTAPKPNTGMVPPPKVANDPITQEAHKIRNDGYDHYRKQGWSEDEIQYLRDSCGHSLPPGRRQSYRSNSC